MTLTVIAVPIEYNVAEISDDLEDFQMSLQAINMESVKEQTLRRVAQEMAEAVRQAVVAEDDITSPAMNGPNERGKGPSMATGDAWLVEKEGSNSYTVQPHPQVRQKTVVLNFGYPGEITPKNGEFLKFTIEGEPVWARSVEGPESTGYWQAAYQQMEKSGRLREIAEQELEEEFEEKFR